MECPVKLSDPLYAKVKPVFIISKIFGLNQFSLPEPRYHVINVVYSAALLLVILANIMYLVYDGNDLNSTQNNVDTKSKLPVITIYVRMMFLILCNILFYVTCVITHKYISAIFTCVNYIDYNVQMFQDGPDQEKIQPHHHRIGDFLFTCLILTSHLLGQVFRYLVSFYSSYFVFIYTIASLTSILLELQFVILLINIRRSFCTLNSHLKRNKHGSFNAIVKKNIMFYDFKHTKSFLNYPFIKAMLRLHYYLCDVCSSINEVYGIKILLIIGYDFLTITSILFKLTSNLLSTSSNSSSSISPVGNENFNMMAHIYLCLLKCFMLYLIVRTTDGVTKEAGKLLKISHKLQLKNDQANLNLELQCFIQRLERHKISFTAYGFFPLDYTLLYTIIGAATTYWVILVQFQLSYNI
ncbi:hypothetical protein M8J77_023363 [Diaphorina citri]|nr:hypothetical protein M8J77_023363 [Diaphorina citri]